MLIQLGVLVIACCHVRAQDKPPPTLTGSRNWNIPDDASIGTLVTTLQPSETTKADEEFVFGLEHSQGFNIVQSNPEPLPIDVNPKTGEVFTNQSLTKLTGKNYYLYATVGVRGSEIVSKFQVWVKIIKRSNSTNIASANSRPPSAIPDYKLPKPQIPPFPVYKSSSKSSTTSRITTTRRGSSTDDDEENEVIISGSSTQSSGVKHAKETESITSQEPVSKIIIAFIPSIVIVVSVIVFGIAFLFRKKICKRRHKMKKDDMQKKSSCSVLSLEESMVLQHWRGARALSNRYDSWDSDSNHQSAIALTTTKSVDKWEIPRHHIKVFNILGEGCFGQVWKCEALNIDNKEGPTVVAVKMLKENAGEQERNDLLQELQVMKMLDPHPNVVRLLACCTERGNQFIDKKLFDSLSQTDPVFVVMEFVPHGKLQSFLRQSRAQRYYNNMHGASDSLTSRELTSFCYQIAKGMQYLSSRGIIHRDLAARNILVGENHTCKVADFGFARDIMNSHVYERKSEGRLPIRWMAPESLYDNIFSVKSDIWSFGVLVWEIVTLGSTPYPGIPAAEVMKRVRDGYRLDKPEHCRRELYNIMYYCWDKDPKERPTFNELVELLEELLLTETEYIQLERFPDHSYYNMVSLSGEKL